MVPKRYEGLERPFPLISHNRLGYFWGGTFLFWEKEIVVEIRQTTTISRVLIKGCS
jgi:hypothetical protein